MRVDEDPSGQSCTAQLLMGSHAEASVALSVMAGGARLRLGLATRAVQLPVTAPRPPARSWTARALATQPSAWR